MYPSFRRLSEADALADSQVLGSLAASQTLLADAQDGFKNLPSFNVSKRPLFGLGPVEIEIDKDSNGTTDSIAKVSYSLLGTLDKIDIDEGCDGKIDSRIVNRIELFKGSQGLDFYKNADGDLTATGIVHRAKDGRTKEIEFITPDKESLGTLSFDLPLLGGPTKLHVDKGNDGKEEASFNVYRDGTRRVWALVPGVQLSKRL